MMTLVEIKHGSALKHWLCSVGWVGGWGVGVCTGHAHSFPIALYVLRNSYSPGAAQAPPLATAARLVALS